jgi:transglutaminase-like putative cysteine protease/uncharacterized protein (DUF58 family)
LLAAWVAGAAIARLTGASAVILLLAAGVIALTFEIVSGWWAARSVNVDSATAPTVVTVGESCRLFVALDVPGGARAGERRRVSVLLDDGSTVSVDAVAGRDGDAPGLPAATAARFAAPGLIDRLTVRVEVAGPAGLIWWRRSTEVAIDTLHVAPAAHGPSVTVERLETTAEGASDARRGNHVGEIDGIRPWRQGDSTNSVHWPSSLRTDELIVHDRLTTADERWIVDLDDPAAGGADAASIRWTLEEALRLGHAVSVRTADGSVHPVVDDEAAARWSAVAAQTQADARREHDGSARQRHSGILQRDVTLRIPAVETETTIGAVARWSAAAAAFASMAMLIGALDRSTTLVAVVFGAIALGAVTSLWVARRAGKRPLVMQAAIALAIGVALLAIVAQFSDVDGLLAALRGPLPDVLMLLVVLHGFEAIDRRTLRVHLAITFVLACYGAGLRIDGALGWWLAAWGAPFVMALSTTSRRAGQRRASALHTQRPMVISGAATARWAGSLVTIGVATLVLLSLIPIPDGPARLGLPALSVDAPSVGSPGGLALPDGSSPPRTDPSGTNPDRGMIGNVVGYPGFTETLDTSVRGDLGDELVMRVRAPEPAFWRGQTFTEFDGRTWTVSPERGARQDGPIIDVPPTIGDALGVGAVPSEELVQTYFVEQSLPNIVFAAYRAEQVVFDGSLWTRPDGALRSDVTLTAGSVYTVVSQRPQVDADILRSQGDVGAFFARFRDVTGGDEIDPFLEIPASTTQRTIDLAAALRTPGESTYDTILAYEAWLGTNTEYDLDAPVPPDGADAVDDFLFESRLGYCEQIASTLTIMLRSQGVPARLATGYVPGERDRVSGVWNVRGSDAHAWVEVWFPQTGWQAFDPTAEVPLAADAGNATVGGDLIAATLSSIASHRIEIGVTLLIAAAAWGAIRMLALGRYRRRRGRWGLLQDRFNELGHPSVGSSSPDPSSDGRALVTTNTVIATTVSGDDRRAVALEVADELDRAAFDPGWADDDQRFARARSALETLERPQR